jgi:hypothetical protein
MDIGLILANLGFDWRVALANLVNFLVIILILKYFAFKPIAKIINEREDKIKKGIEDAERAATEFQMAKQVCEKTIEKGEFENLVKWYFRNKEVITLEEFKMFATGQIVKL